MAESTSGSWLLERHPEARAAAAEDLGTRPDATDCDDQIYLDIDEFKYVDLFLLDGAETAADVEESRAPDPSAAASETEADLAKWRAKMLGTTEDRGVRLDPDGPVDAPIDDPIDVPADVPADDES